MLKNINVTILKLAEGMQVMVSAHLYNRYIINANDFFSSVLAGDRKTFNEMLDKV